MNDPKNPFKHITPKDELPPEHKKQVLEDLDKAKFLLQIAELFTVKQVQTNGMIMSAMLNPSKKKKKKRKK